MPRSGPWADPSQPVATPLPAVGRRSVRPAAQPLPHHPHSHLLAHRPGRPQPDHRVHDVYLTFTSGQPADFVNLNWFVFS